MSDEPFSQDKVDELYKQIDELHKQVDDLESKISEEYRKLPQTPPTGASGILQEIYGPILRGLMADIANTPPSPKGKARA